jgi:hypothetical protein
VTARRWLISAVVVILMAAMAVHVSRSYEDVGYFHRLSASILIVTLFGQFLSQLLFNEAMLLPLRPYVENLRYWEFFMVRTGGLFVGSIVPVAGNIAVRLAYLRRHGLAYSDFTWATLLSNMLAFAAAAALAAFATGVLWMVAGTVPALVLGLSAGGLVLSVAGLFAFQRLPHLAGHPRLHRWSWLSGMRGFEASRRTMTGVFVLSLGRHGLNFVTFGVLYQSLSGLSGDFLTGGLVYALTSPVRMVNITPGNLGVNEWVVAIVGKVLAFDVTTGLIVALLFRGIALAGQGLGVLVGWAWLALRSQP